MAAGLRRRCVEVAWRAGGGGGGKGEEMLAEMLRHCCGYVATLLCDTLPLPNSDAVIGGDGEIHSTGLYLNYFCPRTPACCALRPGVSSKPLLFASVPIGT